MIVTILVSETNMHNWYFIKFLLTYSDLNISLNILKDLKINLLFGKISSDSALCYKILIENQCKTGDEMVNSSITRVRLQVYI